MIATQADVLVDYDRLSNVVHNFHGVIPSTISKWDLDAAARKLGLWHRGVVIFRAEHELNVLMDYCVYNMPVAGLSAAARYMRRNPPAAGSDEELALQAMAGARHAVLSISSIVPGVGVECRDLLRDSSVFMVNRNLSRTARKGRLFASRLLSLPGFEMSTGADLPVFSDALDAIEEALRALGPSLGADAESVDDPRIAPQVSTCIIRACLRSGAADWIRMDQSGADPATALPSFPDCVPDADVGGPHARNRPCPCGSGMKYKHCCGELKRW
ncbi:MAG: SEC-C metal-binding domain-containing protein [Planctomycetota bacterium]|nr:SEC-C metal-binding domain-containing protein [Planctomycetota bacterium]